MTKRPLVPAPVNSSDGANGSGRSERLVAIVDHCATAKALADGIGDKFLAYLLAMTIQEARANLRPDNEERVLRSLIDGVSES